MISYKFRGKYAKRGEWLYGSLIQYKSGETAIAKFSRYGYECSEMKRTLVDPATVGQFTGLYDKNGKEIYEGDIIKEDNLIHKILWIDEASAFCRCDLKDADIRYRISRDAMSYVKVVGNIHDNPEMIEKGGEK